MFPFIASLISIVAVFSFIAYWRNHNLPQTVKVRVPSRDQQYLSSRNRR